MAEQTLSGLRSSATGNDENNGAAVLARALLDAAADERDADVVEEVKQEDQRSLSVGVVGAPNAGKSSLMNLIVGTKVSAVSQKMNATTHEVLGVLTEGNTQICFFDTPGLMLKSKGYPHSDMRGRVESAWRSIHLYDVLLIVFDVHRHLNRPDSRVVRLIERMGAEAEVKRDQKRVLCMNKVDLLEKPKHLLDVIEEFNDLQGFDRRFVISGLKGHGVQDLVEYLMLQAVERPWDEAPTSEETVKNISMEVVREKMLQYLHEEIPYDVEQRMVSLEEMRDGSLRIEQHLITRKTSQAKIIVGKRGSKIGRIGIEANLQLRSILRRDVHLILQVKFKKNSTTG